MGASSVDFVFPADCRQGTGIKITRVGTGFQFAADLGVVASRVRPIFQGGAANQNLLIGPAFTGTTGMALQSVMDGASAVAPLELSASRFAFRDGQVTSLQPPVDPTRLSVSDFGAFGTAAVTDATAAFASAKASAQSRFVNVPTGKHLLAPSDLSGKSWYFAPGATLYNLDGVTASNSAIEGGLQFASDLNTIMANAKGTVFSPFHRTRYVSGAISAPVNLGSSPISANTLVYDGVVANAYDVPAVVNYAAIQYGPNVAATGCAALLNGAVTAKNVGVGTSGGRSELTPISVGLVFLPGGTTANVNAYNDIVMSGPIDTQPAFLAGWCVDTKKREPGQVIDANHAGQFGLALSTGTGGSGFGTAALSAQTTYPLTAMLAVAGHAGAPSITDGASGGSDYGAKYGLLVGGIEANNNWRSFGARSKFHFGACIQDWTDEGIRITGAHPLAASNAAGINSDYDLWTTALLLKSRAGAPTPLPGALYFYQNSAGKPAVKGSDGVEHVLAFAS